MNIAVLGAGMVGRTIAEDLAKTFTVTSFDISQTNLDVLKSRSPKVSTTKFDLSNTSLYNSTLKDFDLVVTAVPGFMGYKVLEAVINAKKNVVDISFFTEDVLQLDKLAKEKDVTVITDCGVAPGMSNFILGRHDAEMKIDRFECYVGGLPVERKPPFEYKAPFSPVDVIQEYLRPARFVEQGKLVTKPALSDRHLMEFDKAGELEAFNTDGLRSLIYTMKHIPEMKEQTLRYPGHIDLIIALQQAGFFDEKEIQLGNQKISALDFTSKLLVDQWKLGAEEEEFTVMRVTIEGENKKIEYNLFDRYDPKTKTSSMARTTGYTCTAAVHLIAEKLFSKKGVFPPELIGGDKNCFDFVVKYLADRDVIWQKSIS